jgi:hypothetical protein
MRDDAPQAPVERAERVMRDVDDVMNDLKI